MAEDSVPEIVPEVLSARKPLNGARKAQMTAVPRLIGLFVQGGVSFIVLRCYSEKFY